MGSAQVLNHWEKFEDKLAEEEEEETLSVCDLVMSSDANEYWNDQQSLNSSSYSSTSTSTTTTSDQDFFEFFSEDFSTSCNNNKSIIFCGKLITYKDQENNIGNYGDNKKGTFNKSLPLTKGSKDKFGSENKKMGDENFDISVKKVSALSNSAKSRWHLFGVGRVSMEIELKDMKMRQSRMSSKAAAAAVAAAGKPGNLKADKGGRRSAKGLWRLLKVLGCKNKHINADVVKASFGCIPHV